MARHDRYKSWYKKKNASALLLVLGMTSLIGFFTIGWWHRCSLSYDIVCQREYYYENFYLADRVLWYGVSIAKQHFCDFLNTKKKRSCIELDVQKALKITKENKNNNKKNIVVRCCVAPAAKKDFVLYVVAILYREKELCCAVACSLVRKEDDRFCIENYTLV